MPPFTRRRFLQGASGTLMPGPLSARISVDTARGFVPYDRMMFGQFLEHFHRQVYGGVFEPGSPLSDARKASART